MASTGRRLALASSLILGSFAAMRDERAAVVERRVADGIRGLRSATSDPVVSVATDLGSVYGLVGTSVALALTGRRRTALDVLGAGAVAWGLAQGAKPLANRPRPYDAGETDRLVAIPAGSSWPSGHSAVAAAMGLALAADGSRRAGGMGTTLAAFVGGSRVYVGVHHPTDVIAGAGVGILSHLLAASTLRRLRGRRAR